MKRKIAGVLGVLLAAALMTACGQNKGGTDSAYPYTWKECSDGSVEVTINGEPEEGYSWTADSSQLLVTEETEKGFTVTPVEESAEGLVTFTCQTSGELPSQVFRIGLSMKTDEKGHLQVNDSWYEELEGNDSAGEGTAYPYQWKYDAQVGLQVYVTTTDHSWQVSAEAGSTEPDDAYLTVQGPSYDDNGFLMTVSGTAESGIVYLKASESQVIIRLDLQTDENQEIIVADHREETWVQTKEDIPGISDLEAQFGSLTIPENLIVEKCSVSVWSDGATFNAAVGSVSFWKNGIYWIYETARDLTLETMINETLADTDVTQDVAWNGKTFSVSVPESGGAAAFWQEDDGSVCALLGVGTQSQEDMLTEAANWIGVLQNGE